MPSTRNSKSRNNPNSNTKNPIVISEPDSDPNTTMVLEDVYPTKPDTEPKINPVLLTTDSAAFQRLSDRFKVVPSHSQLSTQQIISSTHYQPPKWIEYILEDFNKYGIDVNDANILFTHLDKPAMDI